MPRPSFSASQSAQVQQLVPRRFQPAQSSGTCFLTEPGITRFSLAGLCEQFINQTRGFELVEHLDAFAKPILRELIDLVLVQLVFVGDLEDQIALLVRTVPLVRFRRRCLMTVAGFAAVSIAVAVSGGQITDLLDIVVHALLQNAIQTAESMSVLGDVSRVIFL